MISFRVLDAFLRRKSPTVPDGKPGKSGKRRRSRYLIGGTFLGCLIAIGCVANRNETGIPWEVGDMPPQTGRTFLVTGGTSGIGLETAKALAAGGARVVIASRNPEKGREAIREIQQSAPDATVTFEELDLGDLASVRALAKRLEHSLPKLDGLINNAAIMEPPARETTADGFESQFAVNYLGHFALTAEVLPLLRKSDAPRVVTLSSIAAKQGSLRFDDLQFETAYDSFGAYAQSKLACLMFAMELQRRSDAGGWNLKSIASHPGVSRTHLLDHHNLARRTARLLLFQPADQGAVPTLYAATSPDANGGVYYGPTGLGETRGPLGLAIVPAAAGDTEAAARLWALSEELSGSRFR